LYRSDWRSWSFDNARFWGHDRHPDFQHSIQQGAIKAFNGSALPVVANAEIGELDDPATVVLDDGGFVGHADIYPSVTKVPDRFDKRVINDGVQRSTRSLSPQRLPTRSP